MKFLFICFVYFTLSYGSNIKPKRYIVNLNDAPEKRWTKIIHDYQDIIPLVIKESKKFIPNLFQKPLFWFADKFLKYFPKDYAREIQAIANQTGLPLGEIIGINILYDITDFEFKACTSIIAVNKKNQILHGRNLDYPMSKLLRKATIIVDFVRDKKILFTATTFVLSVGILTGQKPNVFSISLNARYSGGIWDNIAMELYTKFRHPVTFEIRKALEEFKSFEDAVNYLSTQNFIAPEYIIIGGTKGDEGAIITRNRWSAIDVLRLNQTEGRWFLLQTNFDYWKKNKDLRKKVGDQYMKKIGQKNITPDTMYQVLSQYPINNKNTIFSSVMSAKNVNYLFNYTYVRHFDKIIN